MRVIEAALTSLASSVTHKTALPIYDVKPLNK